MQYLDSRARSFVRSFTSGNKETAEMSCGKSGFAMARFRNGDVVQTELPNALLTMTGPPVMKKPAAPAKKPKKQQEEELHEHATALEDANGHDEEEGGEEEKELVEDFEVDVGEDEKEMEKPFLEPPPVPAAPASFDHKGRKDAFDKNNKLVPWSTRIKERPMGCTSCRALKGCSPSCWKK